MNLTIYLHRRAEELTLPQSEVLDKWDAKLKIGVLDDGGDDDSEAKAQHQHSAELSKVPYAEQGE